MRDPGRHSTRILVCAYACSPGMGSEESVGWDTVSELASRGHRVTVLTRSGERDRSVTHVDASLTDRLQFEVFDLPAGMQRALDRMGKPGTEIGYILWLALARSFVRVLHARHDFTSSQHVTYGRYWMPSPLSVLPIPFVFGPVGGGESIPAGFRDGFSWKGRLFEAIRDAGRWMGEHLPAARRAARKSTVCFANTRETAQRLRSMGARDVRILNTASLTREDLDRLHGAAAPLPQPTFLCAGRFLEWKGFDLAIRALAASNINDARLVFVGKGPHEKELRRLAEDLGVAARVDFRSRIPREELLSMYRSVDALVHPSMHESGGYVVLEMMASGGPVICLDAGGPALFNDTSCGFIAPATARMDAVGFMADAMDRLAFEKGLRETLGRQAKLRVERLFSMQAKGDELSALHHSFTVSDSVGDNSRVSNRGTSDTSRIHYHSALPATSA